MNETFNDIGKRMPYSESPEYVDQLVERSTECAIERSRSPRVGRSRWMLITSVAATVLLVVGVGMTLMNNHRQTQIENSSSAGPFDEFLNTLSDEEVAMLPCYEIEEIPEY